MTSRARSASSRPRFDPDDVGVLLGVWAHPDDEAYLSAGLMATVRAAGHRVVVATATKGEAGTDDPSAWPPERLAAVREQELTASLAALDVREHRWLGHRDGTLHRISAEHGTAQVGELIDEIGPDTIVTFGPDGMTGHLDHRTVSGWVTAAWHASGRRGRLWYATQTPEFHRAWGKLNATHGLWFEGSTPPSTPSAELAWAVECTGHLLDLKLVALRAQASQTSGLIQAVGADVYRRWWATEYFRAPADAEPLPRERCRPVGTGWTAGPS
jgi:LmbE family N-acetylglucosaminyl deacetylase